ncbi:MAG: hypothetical protein HKO57_10850, partial [Akkermansiaceae bacterium]|nr:hypothetical protein [Akkermansiaceae bacterium]
DYTPPSLPAGGLALDGSLLPSKGSGFQAVLDIEGDLPGASPVDSIRSRTDIPQTFSIE